MIRSIVVGAFLMNASAFAQSAGPTKPAVTNEITEQVLGMVASKYRQLGAWQATFTQETYSTGLGQGSFNQGNFQFVRPNRFRFELSGAEQSSVQSDGKSLWQLQFPRGRNQPAYVRHFSKIENLELQRYLLFLRGFDYSNPAEQKKFRQEFEATGRMTESELLLELKPRKSSEVVRTELRFKRQTPELIGVVIEDAIGNTTTLKVLSQGPIKNPKGIRFRPEIPKNSTIEEL
jgi:outer membrane lipoprotein-sorting protein